LMGSLCVIEYRINFERLEPRIPLALSNRREHGVISRALTQVFCLLVDPTIVML
jgi:hypothetical protein